RVDPAYVVGLLPISAVASAQSARRSAKRTPSTEIAALVADSELFIEIHQNFVARFLFIFFEFSGRGPDFTKVPILKADFVFFKPSFRQFVPGEFATFRRFGGLWRRLTPFGGLLFRRRVEAGKVAQIGTVCQHHQRIHLAIEVAESPASSAARSAHAVLQTEAVRIHRSA